MKFQNHSFNFLIRRTNMDRLTSRNQYAPHDFKVGDMYESSNQHIYLLTVQTINVFLHLSVSWFDCEYGTPCTFQFKEQ